MKNYQILLLTVVILSSGISFAQKDKTKDEPKSVWDSSNFSGLKFRSVGPAFMTGRIADIAIHPEDDNTWYVAVGSGGVWKTTNAGITWNPIFDDQPVYSTGCITIDPNNPHRIWLGTGENVGGRHCSWGDGIYLSEDGGKSWKNMGLKKSEHISKIIVHPENSDVVWVAAQGPLWSKGGKRGLYMTTDGGKNWNNTLSVNDWTGVTDLVIDPRDHDVLYAASWQRHRTVAAYMGGGPGTGLHKSTDGGQTWTQLKKGLPSGNMGKIGLAISPQNPDVLYAAIELELRTGGVYRSEDRGASWTKMSDQISGGTGPHYYQELYACPHNFDRIYFANNYFKVSNDGGKTFMSVPNKWKHVDNHALVFRADDPDYLLVGTDGGLYESFDLADNWRHMGNMPITQFYKMALDDAEPFYNIYGGTQDNNTQGGPSRTDNRSGIQNSDWTIVLGGDGHQPATEPGNPNIVYGQSQQGHLSRIDMITGETISIQPRANEGEPYERYNWDAPVLVSPHNPEQIYVASQRLWRSNNRGDSWMALSDDLTRNEERFDLPIMGRKQSFENAWDVYAMSNYNTITSISESPVQKDLIYIGTDDGLIQVTENAGESWRKIEVNTLPGAPERSYINDMKADLYNANTVYVALDNHKEGDYRPFIYKSIDKGLTWKNISSDLPESNLVWRIAQDHINKDLMFLGTEFGIYFTPDGGGRWVKLNGGLPTISFRDLAIQKREDDLVGASFGRSFYVFDDIKPFREITESRLNAEGCLFSLRDADLFVPRRRLGYSQKGSMGADHFTADNPPFGAVFTYYLKDDYPLKKEERMKREKELNEKEEPVPFPGWDELEEEKKENEIQIWLTVKDENDHVIRRIEAPNTKGFHRIAWDLKTVSSNPVKDGDKGEKGRPAGVYVLPGEYSVSLSKIDNGIVKKIDGPIYFKVEKLREGAIPGATDDEMESYRNRYTKMSSGIAAFEIEFKNLKNTVKNMNEALVRSDAKTGELSMEFIQLNREIEDLNERISGKEVKKKPGEKNNPTLNTWRYVASRGSDSINYGPTEMAMEYLELAEKELKEVNKILSRLNSKRKEIEQKLKVLNAPYFEGQD